jgi:hypothetical protein
VRGEHAGIESGNPLEELYNMLKRTRLSLAISAAFGAGLAGLRPPLAQGTTLERGDHRIVAVPYRRGNRLPVTIIKAEDLINRASRRSSRRSGHSAEPSAQGVAQALGRTAGASLIVCAGSGHRRTAPASGPWCC